MFKTLALLLLLSLFSFPLFAATDYSIEAIAVSLETGQEGVTRVPLNTGIAFGARLIRTGEPIFGPVVVEFEVPGIVERSIGYGEFHCSGTSPVRCVAFSVPDPAAFVAHVETRMTTAGPVTATVRLSMPSDENSANNSDTYSLEVVDKPSLSPYTSIGLYRLEPLQSSAFNMQIVNGGGMATNVVATATLTNGGTITGLGPLSGNAPASCTFAAQVVTCVAPSMHYRTYFGVDVKFVAPERLEGGSVEVEVHATADQEDFDEGDDTRLYTAPLVRHVLVTNTNDEGSGSLRQALLDAALHCALEPCTIDFRIPGAGPHVIQPRTPLPDVIGSVKVDGKTQTAFGGDGDPDGPEIEIDGSLLPPGSNGLVMREGCEIQLLGLEMYGFPNSAVEARRSVLDRETCEATFATIFPPTLISGNVLHGNGRGIVVMDTGYSTIEENVLSRNSRSGLFVARASYLAIFRNRIEENGASGIFLDAGTREYWAGGADISGNVIARNAHWGIARTRNGEISVMDNSIFGNSYQGIDVDLDFDTPNERDDYRRPPNKPALFSAAYDPAANRTIVRGSFESNNVSIGHFTIQLFASSSLSTWGHPQGEIVVLTQEHLQSGEFELSVDGDLRGSYVTATLTRIHAIGFAKPPDVASQGHLYAIPADTSEFSNAVMAQ